MTAIGLTASILLPTLAGLLWLRHGDTVKRQHPLSRRTQVSTLPCQRRWNFGMWRDRLDAGQWRTILDHALPITGVPVAVVFGWCLGSLAAGVPWSVEAFACLCLWFTGPLLNWGVTREHSYYQCATGMFLVGAVGFSCLSMPWLVLPIIVLAIHHWWTVYRPIQRRTIDPGFADMVQRLQAQCPPDSIVVTLGLDWNPTLLFEAERRGLMIPNWPEISREDVQQSIRNLAGYRVGAMILAADGSNGITRLWLQQELLEAGLIYG